MSYISTYCHISLNQCFVNGKQTHLFNSLSIDQFLKDLYTALSLDYPKFYKMDRLTKLAFIGTELLKKEHPEITMYNDNEIALLFGNNNSSALTDINFRESYQNGGSPSPSLFVYTLPNILLGEIAIRNKWYGENMFIVNENFDATYFTNYVNILLNKNAEAVFCGWLNVNNEMVEAFLFFVSKKDLIQLNLPFEKSTLIEIYQENKL